MIKLKKENSEGLSSTVLVGRISTAFPGKGPIIVSAYSMNQGKKEVAHYTVLHDSGEYELIIRVQGCKPFVRKCFVKLDKPLDPMLVELTPE